MRRRRTTWRNLLMLAAAITGVLVATAGGGVSPVGAVADEIINEPLAVIPDGYQVATDADASANGRYVVYEIETNGPAYDRSAHWLDRITGDRWRVTGTDQTIDGAGMSSGVSVSDDGNLVAYGRYDHTSAEPGPNRTHVYLRDRRVSDSTIRLDVPIAGAAEGEAHSPVLSGDGRYVVFSSTARLVADDLNGSWDAYRFSVADHTLALVSRGGATDVISAFPDVSADGSKVAFTSMDALSPEDTDTSFDVYVRDLSTGALQLATTTSQGDSGYTNGDLRISADGSTVVYTSSSSTLVADDTNGVMDVFATHLTTGVTERVSVWGAGLESTDYSLSPSVSGDGRYVAFESRGAASWPVGFWFERAFVRDLATGTTELGGVDANGEPQASWGGRGTALSAASRLLLYTRQSGNLHARDVAPLGPRLVTGTVSVNSAPPTPDQAPGVIACPVGTGGANCAGRKLAFADAVTGAFSLELDGAVDYSIIAFVYGGGATSAPVVWNAGDANPSPLTLSIEFATVYGTVTATPDVLGALGVGTCPAPQLYPDSCPSLKYAMADAQGQYLIRLSPGTYNTSGFANDGGVITKGLRAQLTLTAGQVLAMDYMVDPANARALTGQVMVNGTPPPPLNAANVGACPLVGGQPASCPFPQLAPVDGNGNFNLVLTPGVDYAIVAFASGVQTAPMIWLADAPDPSPAFFNIEYATLQGTVTAAPGVPGALGVGACLDPATWPCDPVRYSMAFNGGYILRLPPGTYNTTGFARADDGSIIQGARRTLTVSSGQIITQNYVVDPSASPAVEQQVPDQDMNDDGTPDVEQLNVAAVPAAVEGEYIAVAAEDGDVVTQVSVTPAADAPVPLPTNAAFDDNVLSFKIPVESGGTRTVEVVYSEPIEPGSAYVKLIDGVWQSFGTIDYERNSVTLTLTDGGSGDSDGARDGVITDPGVLSRPSASGLFAPIDMHVTNVAKAGSAVPVKWKLQVGDVGVDAPSTFTSISSSSGAACAGSTDAVEAYSSGLGLQYRGNGEWQYDWKTQKAWAGQCRTLRLEVAGHVFTAAFTFTK